jgi:hypothetical protein
LLDSSEEVSRLTAKISHVKAAKILHHYFGGMPQLKIAQKCGVNQATVSRCAVKFQKEAAAKGILKATKEYAIMEDINALRSLSIELYKGKASVEEARSGLKMLNLFNSLGVPPEEHKILAKAVSKVKDPDFIKGAMNLIKLEAATGKSYADIVSEYQQLGEEIGERQQAIIALKEQHEIQGKILRELDLTKEKKQAEIAEFEKEAEEKKTEIDAIISQKLAESELTQEKIAKLHPVVDKMNVLGISEDNLETFVEEHQALEEYGINWEEFKTVAPALAKAGEIDADGLAGKLAEYGTLERTITLMKAEMTSLQPQVEELEKEKAQLATEVDGLDKKKVQREEEVGHLETLKKALGETIDAMQAQRLHLDKHLAVLEQDVAKLETKNTALTEEVDQKEQKVAEMAEKLKMSSVVDKELREKDEALQELDARIATAGQKYHLFESFLGLVAGRTEVEIKEFLKLADALISEAQTGKYDPGFMVNTILGELSGGTLEQLVCGNCGAEFVMLKRGQKAAHGFHLQANVPERCPDCPMPKLVFVDKPLAVTVAKVIVSGIPVLSKKPGETTPEEKSQSNNKAV